MFERRKFVAIFIFFFITKKYLVQKIFFHVARNDMKDTLIFIRNL